VCALLGAASRRLEGPGGDAAASTLDQPFWAVV
jgi:hypothetical protein